MAVRIYPFAFIISHQRHHSDNMPLSGDFSPDLLMKFHNAIFKKNLILMNINVVSQYCTIITISKEANGRNYYVRTIKDYMKPDQRLQIRGPVNIVIHRGYDTFFGGTDNVIT